MKALQKIFSLIFVAACVLIAAINFGYMWKLEQPLGFLTLILTAALFAAIVFAVRKTGEIRKELYRGLLAAIVLLGFALRMAAVFFVPCEPISDYGVMFSAAEGVARCNYTSFGAGSYFQRFPHIIYYSLTSGLLMRIFGNSLMTLKVFNVIFKTASIFAMSLTGKELFGRKGSLVCAFLFAVFPADIFYSVVTATENFAELFFVLSAYFIIRAYRAGKMKKTLLFCALAGVTVALGSLYRNVAAFFLAGYAVGILVVFSKKRKLFSAIALLAAFYIFYLGATGFLNISGVIPYKFSEGAEPFTVYMLVGTNFETSGMYSMDDHNVYFEGGADRGEINKIVKERLFKRLSDNTEKIFPLLAEKTRILWSGGAFDSVYWGFANNGTEATKSLSDIPYALCNSFFICVLLCCIFSMLFGKNREIFCVFALVILASHAGLMMIEIQPRYAFSVAFMLLPIAAGAFFREGIYK